MLELIALTFALVFAGWFLVWMMAKAFYNGIGWFDSRAETRRREYPRADSRQTDAHPFSAPRKYSALPTSLPTDKSASRRIKETDEDEWAEYIDI